MIKNGSNKLKNQLLLQSLSPLAFLTIVRNWKFDYPSLEMYHGVDYIYEFLTLNLIHSKVLIIVMLVCAGWVIGAIFSYVSFSAFGWAASTGGYEISDVNEQEDASLNFFMTLIIPLLIDDVGSKPGAITFAIIVIMMCVLLARTKLFYANPVLAILGYHVYEFRFKDNQTETESHCIAIVHGKIKDEKNTFAYKKIDEKVFLLKEST